MKQILLLMGLFLSLSAAAQSKTTRIQETQARLLDVTADAYVKPVTVELKVVAGRTIDSWKLTKSQVENDFRGNIANIRSWAVYMASRKHDVDVIVGATFNFRSTENSDEYEIEIVGFPAVYQNWGIATEADYEWIRLEQTQRVSDAEKIKAVTKK